MQHLQNWLAAAALTPLSTLSLLVLLAMAALLWRAAPSSDKDRDEARSKANSPLFKLQKKFGLHDWPFIPFLFGGLIFLIFLVVLLGFFAFSLWDFATFTKGAEFDANSISKRNEHRVIALQLTALATILGVFIAFPMSLVKLRQTSESNDLSQKALYNDKINAALEDLHAMRQRSVDGDPTKTIWEADVTRRNGAIDRLEALAHEKPDETPRIARTLCTYVKDLSREYPAQEPPFNCTIEELEQWADDLPDPRSDVQRAAQTLGRLLDIQGVAKENVKIDLSGANLQRFQLDGLNFENADFSFARMQHAIMDSASLTGANLSYTQAQIAFFRDTKLIRCNLRQTRFRGAILVDAHLNEAEIIMTKFPDVVLARADLRDAYIFATRFDTSFVFSEIKLARAALRKIKWRNAQIGQDQIDEMFGDSGVSLPHAVKRPDHRWPKSGISDEEFRKEWNDWKTDPVKYRPPHHESRQK